jgi:hypothetical protein
MSKESRSLKPHIKADGTALSPLRFIFQSPDTLKPVFGIIICINKRYLICIQIMTASTSYSLSDYERPALHAPEGAETLLLHSCCAPCAGEIMLAVQASGIQQVIFFYNPNIHPVEEYELSRE